MDRSKTLWSNQSRTFYFLVPNDEKIPPGNFILRTLSGRQMKVDQEALKPFEITQEEAKEWLRDQFGQVVQTAKGKLIDALSRGIKFAADSKPQPGEQGSSVAGEARKTSGSPGLSILAALSGKSEENLQDDPKSILEALKKGIEELGAILEESITPDSDRLAKARQRVNRLRKALNSHGVPVSAKAEEIPNRIQAMIRSMQAHQDAEKAAVELEALADGLERVAVGIAQRLRGVARQKQEAQSEAAALHEDGDDL